MMPIYPFTYTGKELINTDQFLEHYFGARWYDPTLGRFTSVNPLSAKFHSLSPYNYTENNPINLIDPDGRGAADPSTHTDETAITHMIYLRYKK